MLRIKKVLLALIITVPVVTIVALAIGQENLEKNMGNQTASIFFLETFTAKDLQQKYNEAAKKNEANPTKKSGARILIVPGHDDESWGTEFNSIREADLNVNLAERIYKLLMQDSNLEVFLSRDKNGYTQNFANYFETERENIKTFTTQHQETASWLVQNGLVTIKEWVFHNKAKPETANKLFGINKWANENKIDVILHIHFNDYPRKKTSIPGEYSGLSIYIPESQLSNAKSSKAIAEPIFKRLTKFFPASNLPKENLGIVEDQELIAIGSYNTLDAASLLIEYGYIYEPQNINPVVRELAFEEYAQQTYLGLQDFFLATPKPLAKAGLATLPHNWNTDFERGQKRNPNIFALQLALGLEGLYPPQNITKNDCPPSGNFGECTETAVKSFQKKYNIEPASGIVGEKTREKLNELFAK